MIKFTHSKVDWRLASLGAVLLVLSLAILPMPAGASTNIAGAALDFFFPTNGTTFEAGQGYTNDIAAIEAVLTSKCLESAGFQGVPYSPRPYIGDNEEFPNLPYLRAHSFVVVLGNTQNPTSGMSAAERKAYDQQSAVCNEKAAAKFASLTDLGTPLQGEWMRKVTQIDESHAFRRALGGFFSCTAKSGIDITTIDGFFTYLSSQMAANGYSTAVSLHFAGIYAKCLAPAEKVRDNLRARARQTFFSTNAEQINELTSQVDATVKSLGHKYHIKWQTN